MKRRVTINDVAKEAGLSVASVSRVLSGTRPVTPEVHKSVTEAVEKLGYRPNYVARALRRRSTGAVGMLVPHVTHPFYASLVQAIELCIHNVEGVLILSDSRGRPELESIRIQALLDRQIDALLIIPCDEEESSEAISQAAEQVPVILLDSLVNDFVGDFIGVDNETGINLLLDHIDEIGRQKLAFIGGKLSASPGAERLTAYRNRAPNIDRGSLERILTGEKYLEWSRGAADTLIAWGKESVDTIISRRDIPDAIICANDLIALGVINHLTALGIKVPDDVAVTGFDDIRFASICSPPLTTIHQPVEEMCAQAVQAMQARLQGKGTATHTRLIPEIVVRGSTAGTQFPNSEF